MIPQRGYLPYEGKSSPCNCLLLFSLDLASVSKEMKHLICLRKRFLKPESLWLEEKHEGYKPRKRGEDIPFLPFSKSFPEDFAPEDVHAKVSVCV